VYELGLRKHSASLTIPHYILRYAQLIFVLGDNILIANAATQEKQDAFANLWDMTLQFESELSGADRSSVAALQNVETRSLDALMDPDEKGVATGSFVGVGEVALIGAQKATIAEKLIQSE
jgi:hypothetical protein